MQIRKSVRKEDRRRKRGKVVAIRSRENLKEDRKPERE